MENHAHHRRSRRRWLATALALAAVATLALALLVRGGDRGGVRPPPLPPGWPRELRLGMANGLGDASTLMATADFAFRAQYLTGGVDDGWVSWPGFEDGAFVTSYIEESRRAEVVPVFSYYMTFHSSDVEAPEDVADLRTLAGPETMRRYYEQLRLFFERAGAFPETLVVLHVEPDLWGYMQSNARDDDPATITAVAGSSGLAELAGLPDDLTGFAQAFVRLRDALAPNVVLAYSISTWGAGEDFLYSDPPDGRIDTLAARTARFYQALGAPFDMTFAEFTDRDAGFDEVIKGDGGASWWDEGDFARHARFLRQFSRATNLGIVLWQTPYGNTKFRAVDNTWQHFQDNKVEWLLDDPGREHLRTYRDAGVIAILFGRGADGATDASDAAGDGVTNPEPIGANTERSLSADDDGGLFRLLAHEYDDAGPLPLR